MGNEERLAADEDDAVVPVAPASPPTAPATPPADPRVDAGANWRDDPDRVESGELGPAHIKIISGPAAAPLRLPQRAPEIPGYVDEPHMRIAPGTTQCWATTHEGLRCWRRTKFPSHRCYVHLGPFDDVDGLAAAQARVDAALRDRVDHDEETHELVIDSSAEAVRVTVPCTFDVQWANGHGGTLSFVRFSIGADVTAIEEIDYFAFSMRRDVTGADWTARRARVPTKEIAALVHLARAQDRTVAELRLRPGADEKWGGGSGLRFVLTRVVAGGRRLLEREFSGSPRFPERPQTAGLQFVAGAVREHLDAITSWTEVPPEDLRATHWNDAFVANADMMLRNKWVMHRSVEALGVFGTPAAVPTLRRLDAVGSRSAVPRAAPQRARTP